MDTERNDPQARWARVRSYLGGSAAFVAWILAVVVAMKLAEWLLGPSVFVLLAGLLVMIWLYGLWEKWRGD